MLQEKKSNIIIDLITAFHKFRVQHIRLLERAQPPWKLPRGKLGKYLDPHIYVSVPNHALHPGRVS